MPRVPDGCKDCYRLLMRGLLVLLAAIVLVVFTGAVTVLGQAAASAEQLLMEAAYLGDLAQVQSLVAARAVIDARDAEQRTSLMWAAFNGHTQVVEYLLENGAVLDRRDASGRTALMYASSGPFAETVELLLRKGADVDNQGTLEGFTALMTAAAEGQLEVVRLLLEHGANRMLEDKDGDTALSFAREKGHAAVVELLENPPPAKSEE